MKSETAGLEAGLSIADAARASGLSVHTLRYYDRAGLIGTTATSGSTSAFVDRKIAIYEELIE